MLRLALEVKGLARHTNTHYDLPQPSDPPVAERNVPSPAERSRSDDEATAESDGVYL